MQDVNSNTALSPLLTPRDSTLLQNIACRLAGIPNTQTIADSFGILSEHLNNIDIIFGTLHCDEKIFRRFAFYSPTELSIDLLDTELSSSEYQNLTKNETLLSAKNNENLFLAFTQTSRRQLSPSSEALTHFSFPAVSNENQKIHGFVATSSIKTTPIAATTVELLSECWEIFSASIQRLIKQNAVQEQTTLFNGVIKASPSVYGTWNNKTGWKYHNVNSFVELGIKQSEIDISQLNEHNPMHPDDWQENLKSFYLLVTTGVGYQHNFRASGPSGITHWYRANTEAAETNSRGEGKFATSVSRNISTLKQAEFAAIETLEREQWLTKQSHRVFNCADFSSMSTCLKSIGKFLKVSRCVIRVVDPETQRCNLVAEWHRPGETSLATLFPEMTSQTGIGWIERLIKLGNAYVVNHFQKEVPNKKLLAYYKAINANSTLTQPMIKDGKLVGYFSVLDIEPHYWSETDIHITQVIADTIHMAIPRNRLLEELREYKTRSQLAMQDSAYSLWEHDLKTDTVSLSPHFYKALGYKKPHDNYQPATEILKYIHPDDGEILLTSYLKQINSESGQVDLEFRFKHYDESFTWLLMRGKVIKTNKGGKPTKIIGINMDITHLKETQSELKNTQQKAEIANHSKGEFLERMSHEIRTPMNAILGMSYLALDTPLHNEQKSHLEDIESAAKSLLHIIDDILDFSKIENGVLTISKEQFNIKTTTQRLLNLFSVRAEESGNTLEFKFTDDIPEFVIGDPNRVGQVITNLLSNALKFTKNGSVSISVQVVEVIPKSNSISLLFSVSDSGIGLNKEQLERLFDPFTQAENSTTRKYGGTGLGLSICKNLVEMMGGSIQVISLPDIGTTFHFTIVFSQALQNNTLISQSSSNKSIVDEPNLAHRLSGKKVLLTEDNIVNQKVALGMLKKFQVDAVIANNGKEALNILASSGPDEFDAILMDIDMPILDGLEATKAIRRMKNFETIPIIAMTAHAMVGDKERCLAAGMNEHISKPVKPSVLQNTLVQFLIDSRDDIAHPSQLPNDKSRNVNL